jgi:alpha-beta hydrolase superfamily lysophospholipase
MIARARLLRAHGFAVLLYDARGHGESDRSRVSFGLHETRDLLGALAYMRSRERRKSAAWAPHKVAPP